jgi:hypothetical protein
VRQQDLSNDIAPLERIQICVQVCEADHAALEAIDRQFPFQIELGVAADVAFRHAAPHEGAAKRLFFGDKGGVGILVEVLEGAEPHGSLIAPPSFIFACLASVQFGWRGLGGFHTDTTMTFHRHVRLGDRIVPRVVFDGFEGPSESYFGGRRIKDYIRQEYRNQHGELVATFICSRMRFERTEMQKRAKSREIEVPHPWTEDELAAIDEGILAETPRGAEPRYWDDVEVGDEIDIITKGPIGLTDEIAFVASGAAPIPRVAAHRVSLKRYHRHPRWAFRDPVTHAYEPVYSVHYNDYAAKLQGAQMAYDVGIQRTCWQIHSLTNWMGDAGFLKALTSQYRTHVYLSDVVRLGGRIEAKDIDPDGDHVVVLTTRPSTSGARTSCRERRRSPCRTARRGAPFPEQT